MLKFGSGRNLRRSRNHVTLFGPNFMRDGIYTFYVDDSRHRGFCEAPWANVQGDRDEWKAFNLEVQRKPKMLLRLPNWQGILCRLLVILPFQHECQLTLGRR